jgi:hypothetical protein
VDTRFKLEDGDLHVKNTQDVEDILENNTRLQAEPQKADWGRHVASVPNVFITKMMNEEFAKGNVQMKLFDKEFDRLYWHNVKNNPEWRAWRTDNPSNPFYLGWRK